MNALKLLGPLFSECLVSGKSMVTIADALNRALAPEGPVEFLGIDRREFTVILDYAGQMLTRVQAAFGQKYAETTDLSQDQGEVKQAKDLLSEFQCVLKACKMALDQFDFTTDDISAVIMESNSQEELADTCEARQLQLIQVRKEIGAQSAVLGNLAARFQEMSSGAKVADEMR